MKRSNHFLRAGLWLIFIAYALPCFAATLLFEDFEGSLAQWTGKTGQTHHGLIVPDPLASGRGKVLTFTALNGFGDIFTTNVFSSTNTILISFDYLGLSTPGSIQGNFEGYFGLATGLPGTQTWLASGGTATSTHLPDDGQWHRIIVLLNGPGAGEFRLTLEDYAASGVPGDTFFDNITLTEWPYLTIGRRGVSQMEVRWPTNSASYFLETTADFTAQNWTQITNTPVVIADEFTVGLSPQSPHQFFRLRKP